MAKRPIKSIAAFRLPNTLLKTLTTKAGRQHISRNKLVELILHEHMGKTDRELRDMINKPREDEADDNQIDLFA
jgi:hypothetical protein